MYLASGSTAAPAPVWTVFRVVVAGPSVFILYRSPSHSASSKMKDDGFVRHDGFDMDSCDGGLCLRISHGSVACSAWRWTPAHERRGQNARSVREEVAAEFSCVLPPAVMSIVESADRALLETEESASAAAAMAISNHPSLRAAWREILSTYGTLKAADDVDDDATLIVTVERLDDEIQDDPYAAAPTGDVSVGPVGGGCGTEVAPLRVGRYHYGAKTPPKAALRILERDARVPTAELRDLGGLSACAAGDMPQLRALIAAGWPAPHAVDKFGSTALMWAASYGKVEVARLLIEEARCAVDTRNKAGRTALMFACKYASQVSACYEFVRYLLHEARADVTVRMKDDSGAFDWAVFGGHRPTMELIAAHPDVDINGMNRFGCAAVQWAAAAGNVDTLRWLHNRGLELGHVNGACHGAVAKAAWKGHLPALEWLLLDPSGPCLRWQCALRDPEGRSVAELAAMNGMHEAATLLAPLVVEAERGGRARALEPPPSAVDQRWE